MCVCIYIYIYIFAAFCKKTDYLLQPLPAETFYIDYNSIYFVIYSKLIYVCFSVMMSLVAHLGKCGSELGQDEVYKLSSTLKGNCKELFNSRDYILRWKCINISLV
jgi:hypothetical protein